MAKATKLAIKQVGASTVAVAETRAVKQARVAAKAQAITAWWHATHAVVRRLSNDLDAISEELTNGDDSDELLSIIESPHFAIVNVHLDEMLAVLLNYNPAAASIPNPLPADPAA